jgi:transcriptional regulator with XRE-family HTH domain
MFSEVFPSRLKEARKSHGFTLNDVAIELKVNLQNISRYETGITEPDIETLTQLADFYGTSIDYLIGMRGLPGKREELWNPTSNWDGVKLRSSVFPVRMKLARTKTGLSQSNVAKELKIPRSTLTKYELGQLQPSLETLAKITVFYNVKADWLLGLIDENNPVN